MDGNYSKVGGEEMVRQREEYEIFAFLLHKGPIPIIFLSK